MKLSRILQDVRALRRKQVEGYRPKPMDVCQAEEHVCINCNTTFRGDYCPCCGQSANIPRLTLKQGAEDLLGIFTNFDSGFLHTCLELLARPGYMIRDYLSGKRMGYVKPLQLLFLTGTIRLITDYILNGDMPSEDLGLKESSKDESFNEFFDLVDAASQWLMDNQTMFFLIAVTLLVIPNYISFNILRRDKTLNLAEHFFIMIFVGCQMIIIDTIQLPFEKIFGEFDSTFSFGVPLFFTVISYKQILGISMRRSIVHTVISVAIMLAMAYVILTAIATVYYMNATTT